MFKNKLKKIIGNDENQGNNKRKIENLVFLVVVLSVEVESLEVSVLLEVSALESEFLTEE